MGDSATNAYNCFILSIRHITYQKSRFSTFFLIDNFQKSCHRSPQMIWSLSDGNSNWVCCYLPTYRYNIIPPPPPPHTHTHHFGICSVIPVYHKKQLFYCIISCLTSVSLNKHKWKVKYFLLFYFKFETKQHTNRLKSCHNVVTVTKITKCSADNPHHNITRSRVRNRGLYLGKYGNKNFKTDE